MIETAARSSRRAEMVQSLHAYIRRATARLERMPGPQRQGDDAYWKLWSATESLKSLTQAYKRRLDRLGTDTTVRTERCHTPTDTRLTSMRDASLSANKVLAVQGYAAVFNEVEEIVPGLFERIAVGSFGIALSDWDGQMLVWSHDPGAVLASRRNGTLTLRPDRHGLHVDATFPDSEWGRPAYAAIERGDVRGMSFAFSIDQELDEWEPYGPGASGLLRTIHGFLKVHEVSPTAFPQYKGTNIKVVDSSRSAAPGASRRLPQSTEDARTRSLRRWVESLSVS